MAGSGVVESAVEWRRMLLRRPMKSTGPLQRIRRQELFQFGDKGRHGNAHSPAKGSQFERVDPPFAPLAFGDERLGRVQLFRQLLLGQALPFSALPQ